MTESAFPKHIAIIMDGNGRWAESRGYGRTKGHERGAETVRAITTYAAQRGVSYLSLYAFSTENWSRPKSEVTFLMTLLDRYLKKELPTYQKNGIAFRAIGDRKRLSEALQERIRFTEEATARHVGLTQVLAINYGAKDEITRAAKKLVAEGETIDEYHIAHALDTADIPDVDMLIRTGGEKRLSNFLLWQSAYAELFFTDTLWPDFDEIEFGSLIDMFSNRTRRFGGI